MSFGKKRVPENKLNHMCLALAKPSLGRIEYNQKFDPTNPKKVTKMDAKEFGMPILAKPTVKRQRKTTTPRRPGTQPFIAPKEVTIQCDREADLIRLNRARQAARVQQAAAAAAAAAEAAAAKAEHDKYCALDHIKSESKDAVDTKARIDTAADKAARRARALAAANHIDNRNPGVAFRKPLHPASSSSANNNNTKRPAVLGAKTANAKVNKIPAAFPGFLASLRAKNEIVTARDR